MEVIPKLSQVDGLIGNSNRKQSFEKRKGFEPLLDKLNLNTQKLLTNVKDPPEGKVNKQIKDVDPDKPNANGKSQDLQEGKLNSENDQSHKVQIDNILSNQVQKLPEVVEIQDLKKHINISRVFNCTVIVEGIEKIGLKEAEKTSNFLDQKNLDLITKVHKEEDIEKNKKVSTDVSQLAAFALTLMDLPSNPSKIDNVNILAPNQTFFNVQEELENLDLKQIDMSSTSSKTVLKVPQMNFSKAVDCLVDQNTSQNFFLQVSDKLGVAPKMLEMIDLTSVSMQQVTLDQPLSKEVEMIAINHGELKAENIFLEEQTDFIANGNLANNKIGVNAETIISSNSDTNFEFSHHQKDQALSDIYQLNGNKEINSLQGSIQMPLSAVPIEQISDIQSINIDHHIVMQQVVDKVEQLTFSRSNGSAVIELSPHELGTITINVKSFGTKLEADFNASNSIVQKALEQNKPALEQAVESQGWTMNHNSAGSQDGYRSSQEARQDFQRAVNLQALQEEIVKSQDFQVSTWENAQTSQVNYLA